MNPSDVPGLLWQFPRRFLRATHQLGRMVRRDLVGLTPEQIRLTLDGFARLYPGHFHVAFERTECAGVPCGLLYPRHVDRRSKQREVLVLMHGGGFAFGSALTHRAFASALVHALDCEVWIPEYRLAPECPFPAPLEDAVSVVRQLSLEGESPWVLGDSAGGNLALSAVLEVQKEEGVTVAGVGLFSPWLDLHPQSNSNRLSKTENSPFERLDMVEYASHYLRGISAADPRVAPLKGALQGLPPVYLEASKAEYLYPDFELARIAFANSKVEFLSREEERALHGWQLFPDVLPEARRSVKHFASFVKAVSAKKIGCN